MSAATGSRRLVAVVATTAVGLASAVPTWIDDSGPQTVLTSVSH